MHGTSMQGGNRLAVLHLDSPCGVLSTRGITDFVSGLSELYSRCEHGMECITAEEDHVCNHSTPTERNIRTATNYYYTAATRTTTATNGPTAA